MQQSFERQTRAAVSQKEEVEFGLISVKICKTINNYWSIVANTFQEKMAMFRCKTAWFSNSVPQACRTFWISEGGSIAQWRTADYLFSEDATCPDTLRIFESKDYLWNKVTIFHSLFLSACQKRQSVKSLNIGHYVLPPASIQDEVRNVVGRLIWEHEDKQSVEQDALESFTCPTEDESSEEEVSIRDSESSDADSSENEVLLCDCMQRYPVKSMITGYVRMDKLQKYSGDLCDFHHGSFQCFRCKALCCLPST
ncbi:telomere repeats-binding bouquet formation protein 2 [Archocentrus centrarchus]|uniref:telomere repeats-binding bouquet formation protein 2 n=1 Tax=Archocentrus centrarchus TaxID=63155 RepID=UPI0011E9D214|nr:telomere repeats-binding bouquet formation protein 2 [Archocentrus centrarchus]